MASLRAMARFLTALFLAGLFLVPTPVQSAPADLTILNEALAPLRTQHWNPSIDMLAIVRAGVPGLNRALARAGVTQRIEAIPEGADESAAITAFGQRLDEAVRLAGGRVAERDLLYWALRSMFARTGSSHTYFLTPLERQGGAGIGIDLGLGRDVDRWTVVDAAPEGPAGRAGIHRGDVILRIDDFPASELTLDDMLAMIEGAAPGTSVRLTLRRGQSEIQVVVTRGTVTWRPSGSSWPVAEGRMLDDGIAYLRVYRFRPGTGARVRSEFTRLLDAGPRALVLDLRSNTGGPEGLVTLGLFVPQGTRVRQNVNRAGHVTFGATTDVPIAPGLPLTVLINRHTGSMAEVVAAAFKETGRASLVGERTVGAVGPSQLFGLSDGSGAVITTERTLTAQGRELEGHGVRPDVEFPHDLTADRDLLLERAVQLLLQRLN